jgi:hypothetical protein
MSDQRELDRLLDAFFVEGTEELADRVIDNALEQIDHTQQRRVMRVPRRFSTMNMPARVAAAAVIGVLAVVGTLYLTRPDQPAVGGPPSASPTDTTLSLTWTESSLDQDWPVPIRAAAIRDAVVVPLVDGELSHYTDPLGDIGPTALPWLDIERISLLGGGPPGAHGVVWAVDVDLAADIPLPVADPGERWIAYGLVLDTNGDDVPDVRLGMDNMPVTAEPGHRAWRTELDTGRTMSAAGVPYGLVGGRYVDTYFPGESTGNVAEFKVGLRADEPTFRFYAWASVIEDGRVVATDYAPDLGWLEPGPDVKP